jgi:hypothetical protein
MACRGQQQDLLQVFLFCMKARLGIHSISFTATRPSPRNDVGKLSIGQTITVCCRMTDSDFCRIYGFRISVRFSHLLLCIRGPVLKVFASPDTIDHDRFKYYIQ